MPQYSLGNKFAAAWCPADKIRVSQPVHLVESEGDLKSTQCYLAAVQCWGPNRSSTRVSMSNHKGTSLRNSSS
jgi:hypothetical protein